MTRIPKACYLLLFGLMCCKKPYAPPAITTNFNYLVVEGVINTGPDSTIIKLSRTVPVSSVVVANPELHATVTIISDANAAYPLKETGNGYYATPGLNLSLSAKYALKIVTSDGKTYQSDFVAAKNSPPIDSVNYVVQSNAIQVNLHTHDPANKTTYYRWSYVETYIIHAHNESFFELQTSPFDTVVLRKPGNQVYTCWPSDTSTTVILGSTAKLTQDVIANQQLTSIPITSEKIADRYSILVKQYALTQEAYNYWLLVKTDTEQLGSIFDAQPSELPGNIHCITTPAEPVIGYMGVGAVSQVRIYIDSRHLPILHTIYPVSVDGCYIGTYLFAHTIGPGDVINDVPTWIYSGKQYVLNVIGGAFGGPVQGYTATDRFCADCTLRGPNRQPDFWTN